MGKGGGSQQPTTQTVQQSNIPEYARPYFEDIMTRGQTASQVQYQPFTGERVAAFSPLQERAFGETAQLGPSPLIGQAAGLTGLAAGRAMQAGQYTPLTAGEVYSRPGAMVRTGSFTQPGIASAYMSPYMQNVVDIQTREAQRQADIARTGRQAQATAAGAFGGSRQAVMEAEAARNLAQQKGDIQATGQQAAFQQAQQAFQADAARQLQARLANQQAGLAGLQAAEQSRQFGAGLGQQGIQQLLGAAGQLGQLGGTAFGQQVGAIQAQQQAGAAQQAQEQQRRDLAYEEFMRQQLYPQSQLQFLSSLLRGSVVAPQQTLYSYQQQPSTISQLAGLAGGLGSLGKAFGAKDGGEVPGYADGGIVGEEGDKNAFASNISKLVKLGMSDPRLIDRDMTATPLEKNIAKMKVAQMRRAFSNQQALDQGLPPEEPILSAGVGSLDVEEPEYADGGIVAFQAGGDPAASARYQGALSQSFPMEIGRRVGAGIADIVSLPGQFAWEIDPVTGKLRRKYEREGFFPISRDVGSRGEGIAAGYAQQARDAEAAAQARRVAEQTPPQPPAPTRPEGTDFAAQGIATPSIDSSIRAAVQAVGRDALAAPKAPPAPSRTASGIAGLVAPAAAPVDEFTEAQRALDRATMAREALPTGEEAEKARRKAIEEKFPSELADRLKEFQTEAKDAIKQRDQDRWLAVAQGFFAAAAGQSPNAMQNFAQGLGLTAKEFTTINKDFQAAEQARKRMELALRQADRAERMGSEKEALAARDRAEGLRAKTAQSLADMGLKLESAQVLAKLKREGMAQEERLTREKIGAQREAMAEVRAARSEEKNVARKNALAQRFGAEVDRLAKLYLSGMGPVALTNPNAALAAEQQARQVVLQRNPQYREVAGEEEVAPASMAVKRYNLATGKLE